MALSPLILQHLIFVFGILGNIVSFGVYLAPLPTFWRIFKNKSTLGFQSIPYSVALFSAMLLLYYAALKETNGTMIITINSIGCVIEGSYLIVYLIYAPKQAKVYTAKLLGLFNVAFFGLIVLTTMAFVHGGDKHMMFSKGGVREHVVGWICGIFSVCVFAAPLSVMRMVIKTKSVEFMPFWLSFALTLCAIMWFFYGFLIKDFYIALPNILGLAFGITQMILYIIYKESSKKKQKGNNNNNNNNNNGDNLVVKEANMMQLQEIAVDIKRLEKGEKIEQDSNEHQNRLTAEVIVEEMVVEADNNNNNNDSIVNENETKNEVTSGKMPRGGSNV